MALWTSIDWALLCFSVLCLFGLIAYIRRKTAELAQVNLDYLDTRVQESKHMKEFTEEELKGFKGNNNGAIYVAADGIVFDMSSARGFYGPGAGYNIFAGVDATYGLAHMNLEPSTWKAPGSYTLDAQQTSTLGDWVKKFLGKYPVKGYLSGSGSFGTLEKINARLEQEDRERTEAEEALKSNSSSAAIKSE